MPDSRTRPPAYDGSSQREVIDFLSTPAAYGRACDHVERVETHISVVFLANDRAFKLKRSVHLPYVDYSTLERRRDFCERELRINRRTAPDLYLRVVAVTHGADGMLAIDGDGEPVEWLVEMARFDQAALFDALAQRGSLGEELAGQMAWAVAQFHASAAPRRDHGGAAGMRWVLDDNRAELDAAGEALDAGSCDTLYRLSHAALTRHAGLLDARRDAGWVRECHGDLHLRNICLIGGVPVLFDAIEFNDELSCVDVLYDMAFLVMDLLHRGLQAQANRAINAWLERLPQYDAAALLGLFLSCRAAIRCKVLVTAGRNAKAAARARLFDEARAYLDRALRLITPGSGAIVAVGGLSGSGKSTVAQRLAPLLGSLPGAIVLRSDVVRKRMFGVEPTMRLPATAYRPDVSSEVYETLVRSAREVARAGRLAVVDAVFPTESVRRVVEKAACDEGVAFAGLWLEAPADVLKLRIARRQRDVSDATVEVLQQQSIAASSPSGWRHINSAEDVERVTAAARETLRPIAGLVRD